MDLATERLALVRRGRALEYFTIGYNALEGIVSITAGLLAGSVSLTGFGLDSAIEVGSSAALLWRLRRDANECRREAAERIALRIAGWCFLALAAYLVCDSALTLILRKAPEQSIAGIAVASASAVLMPLLARAKRNIAQRIGSAALRADSKQADFCAYLSALVLVGLVLNSALGWWWADPIAALAMGPVIVREGLAALSGKSCCGEGCG
ncbi:MAG TPA: cation transporter [Bryobacteraceae bacterium]|nr:cation transporter [Bryobacteraceae bacterium]